MRPQVLVLLTVAVAASAFPSSIYNFKTDDMDIEQKGTPGKSVEGEYSWVAPDGREVFIKYVADRRGFRVIDSKNRFTDWDSDRSSSSSAGDEETFSVPKISPPKKSIAAKTRAIDTPVVKSAKFSNLAPSSSVAKPERKAEPEVVVKKAPAAAPSPVAKRIEAAPSPVAKRIDAAPSPVAERIDAAEVETSAVVSSTTPVVTVTEEAAAPVEEAAGAAEEGAEEEEAGEAEEGGEEAEYEEEAEAEENEEV